jgi:two-component system nitrogen regulation response regulator GlnG
MSSIAYVGHDTDTPRYLARRLKALPFAAYPTLAGFPPPGVDLALVVLELDGDFPEPFLSAVRALEEKAVPFLVVSSVETMKAAVQSMKIGAYDYFLASEDKDELIEAIYRRLDPKRLHQPEPAEGDEIDEAMVGRSQKIQEVFKLIGKIASSNVSVLLRGESGTGKELVARQIHANSPRRRFPFVVIDCAAIPRDLIENELFGHEAGAYSGAGARGAGKFDAADNGTVFLDEISELDLDLQSKILRVIQQGTFDRVGGTKSARVDVRTLATTQANLEEMVRAGRFRQDLYHRLNVISLWLPPLRERSEDIPLLVHHFVRKHGPTLGRSSRQVSSALMSRLTRYHWPGNVRELENVVRRALLLERGPVLTPRFLDEFPVPGEGPVDGEEHAIKRLIVERLLVEELNWKRNDVHAQMTQRIERMLLRLVLRETEGNQVAASRVLGISRNTLRVKMAEHGIDSQAFR